MVLLLACDAADQKKSTSTVAVDTIKASPGTTGTGEKLEPEQPASAKSYANRRFRNVVVERVGKDSFLVRGEGQIFEANFGWIIEDGHEELKQGFQMTDAGAPEWGKFTFGIRAEKKRANSTLSLILFESSAEDGRRMDELPVPLY